MSQNKVIVLSTGGTFEKSYSEQDGALANRESQLKNRLLGKLRLPGVEVEVHTILAKDSLHLDDEDREFIFTQIQEYSQKGHPLIILHGTDTMEITLKHCYKENPTPKVAIVFTGAMRPLGYEDSDGPQNFIEALMAAQMASPGFYISFHNQLLPAPNVQKNHVKGTFEAH